MAYATADQLDAFLEGDPAPAHPERLLELASDLVDDMLVGAIYATDSAGLPTDVGTAAILRRATLLQAQYMRPDETGREAAYESVTTGGTGWTRATGANGSTLGSQYAPSAQRYLVTRWTRLK